MFHCFSFMPYKINQWVQWGDASYAEYIYEEDEAAISPIPERETTELQNNFAIAFSNLLSAQYQIKNLSNTVVPVEQRLKFLESFLDKSVEIFNSIRKEI